MNPAEHKGGKQSRPTKWRRRRLERSWRPEDWDMTRFRSLQYVSRVITSSIFQARLSGGGELVKLL